MELSIQLGKKQVIKKNLRILLAEDNLINMRVTKRFLDRMGHTAVGAKDGHEAINILRGGSFDLILMDVEMPGLNGVEAAALIRNGEAGEENKQIPIIAMSAHSPLDFREHYDTSGMNRYVGKPVDFTSLQSLLQEVVR